MEKLIMALDAGTTSNRCILFDKKGNIRALARREFAQIFPKPGWVEHDPMEIWSTMLACAVEAMSKVGATADDIAAIGITNQRETAVVWDKDTGLPLCNAIVWQCRRTAEYCDELKLRGLTDTIREKTGLVVDAYFSATKVRWMLENIPGAREKAESGKLLFGTVETWLIWKLTEGSAHVTDVSNASRTMLFNIHTLDWDGELLELFGIPRAMLPAVRPSSAVYGYTSPALFGAAVPIAGAAGDQQAALFGQGCFAPGEAKNTYGTGCFLLMNTGTRPVICDNGLLTTVAWGADGKVEYALEGSVFSAGSAVQWLRDELGLISSAAESEALARQVSDTNGCYFVPAFTGLGAPYWDPYARGALVGVTRGVNRSHVVRAVLEAISYQSAEVLAAMNAAAGLQISSLKVDGGASANDLLMQLQADIMGAPVIRPENVESTAMGAAYLAGLATGFWKSREEVLHNRTAEQTFYPAVSHEEREKKLRLWRKAVQAAGGWAKDEG